MVLSLNLSLYTWQNYYNGLFRLVQWNSVSGYQSENAIVFFLALTYVSLLIIEWNASILPGSIISAEILKSEHAAGQFPGSTAISHRTWGRRYILAIPIRETAAFITGRRPCNIIAWNPPCIGTTSKRSDWIITWTVYKRIHIKFHHFSFGLYVCHICLLISIYPSLWWIGTIEEHL